MIATNINNLYPRPSLGSTGTVLLQQAKSVTSTAAVQFSAFDTTTTLVFFDIQSGDVIVTFDGSTPATASSGNRLATGTNYTWSRGTMLAAKFIAVSTTAFISAQEFQV